MADRQIHWGQRSYVLRQGRMSSAKKQSYAELMPLYSIPFTRSTEQAHGIFPQKQTLIVEIGFGMGQATAEIALKNPQNNYLAIDVHTPGVTSLLRKIEQLGLHNLRIIQHDAYEVFAEMLPDSSLAGVHIFFPDPWPKKRHAKRRLIQEPFLNILIAKLSVGSYLYIITDWQEYAKGIEELCEASPNLEKALNSSENSILRLRPQTPYERKGIAQGHSISELYYTKVAQSGNKPQGQLSKPSL